MLCVMLTVLEPVAGATKYQIVAVTAPFVAAVVTSVSDTPLYVTADTGFEVPRLWIQTINSRSDPAPIVCENVIGLAVAVVVSAYSKLDA